MWWGRRECETERKNVTDSLIESLRGREREGGRGEIVGMRRSENGRVGGGREWERSIASWKRRVKRG